MTELIWDGKYDAAGKRTAPLRLALPFQTVETVNESAQQRQRGLDLFADGRAPAWRNRHPQKCCEPPGLGQLEPDAAAL
jgi:adenine-specific DNA-methyltransferase